jgi:phosphoglycolate phosphatase
MTHTNNKKLIMFDFDGVLVDTLLTCFTVSQEVNEDMSLEEYKGFFEGNIYNAIRKNGEPRKINTDFINRYSTLTRTLTVPSELKQVLKTLATNYIFTVVSSTQAVLIREILERESLAEYFDDILGSDVHKSKVVKIQMILEKYAIKSQNCAFVTDTLGDIKEAQECSVPSIAVTWGFHDPQTLQKGNPAYIVDTPEELLEAVYKTVPPEN